MAKFKKPPVLMLPSTTERVEKFINYLMLDGQKNIARKIFNDSLAEIKKNGHVNPTAVWEAALENAAPQVMVKSKRIGGAVYQVPIELPAKKRYFYSCKWIIDYSRAKKGSPMHMRLAEELMAAYSGAGNAVKKKEDAHKMAEANKAFAYLAKYIK